MTDVTLLGGGEDEARKKQGVVEERHGGSTPGVT